MRDVAIYGPTAAVIICIVVALMAVVIGAKVQKYSRFAVPKDIVTISIMLFILADIYVFPILDMNSGGSVWYPCIDLLLHLSFAAGYMTGYMINGRQIWTMIVNFAAAAGEDIGHYRVIYQVGDIDCIADQNNRALLKRWIFGIHHKIVWKDARPVRRREYRESRRHPILRLRYKKLWLNGITELPPEYRVLWQPKLGDRILWTWRTKVYTTSYTLAEANQAEQREVIQTFSRLDTLNEEIRRLNYECEDLRRQLEIGITNGAVMLAADIKRGNPVTGYLAEKKRRAAEEKKAAEKEKEERHEKKE